MDQATTAFDKAARVTPKFTETLGPSLDAAKAAAANVTKLAQDQIVSPEALEYAGLAFGEKAKLQGNVAGLVRLATSDNLATHFILPSLEGLMNNYPELRVEVLSGVQSVNLHRRDASPAGLSAYSLRSAEERGAHAPHQSTHSDRSGLTA